MTDTITATSSRTDRAADEAAITALLADTYDAAGEEVVAEDRLVNATWVFHHSAEGWTIAAYHNSPSHV